MTRKIQVRPTWYAAGVAAATLALLGVLLAWSVLTPGFRAPDEPQHVSTTLRLALHGSYPAPGTATMEPFVAASEPVFGMVRPYDLEPLAPEGPPRDMATRTVGELNDFSVTPEVDWMTQHPPLPYATIAAGVRMLGVDGLQATTALMAMRWLSLLALLPVPALLAHGVRRLGLGDRTAVAAAFSPLLVPQVALIGAVVTNGTLLVLLSTLVLVLSNGVLLGDLRRRTAVLLGLALAAALLTKGFALLLYPSVGLAYAGAWVRDRRAWRPALTSLGVSLLGLWWWIRNYLVHGSVQPSGVPPEARGEQLGDVPTGGPVRYALTFLDGFSSNLLFNLNDFETTWPSLIRRGTALAFILLLCAALVIARREQRWALLLAAGPGAAVFLVTLVNGYGGWAIGDGVHGARGRYVQMAILALAIALGVLLSRLPDVTVVVPALAAVVSVVALGVAAEHWWQGQNPWGRLLTVGVWWPGGTVVVVAGVIALAAASAVATVALRRLEVVPATRTGPVGAWPAQRWRSAAPRKRTLPTRYRRHRRRGSAARR